MEEKMFARKKLGLAVVVAILCLIIAACTAATETPIPEETGVIKLVEQDWTGQVVTTYLAKVILEEEMGYDVELVFVPGDSPAQWTGMATGDVDGNLELWPTYNDAGIKEFIDEKKVAKSLGELGVIGGSGWFVPTYVIEGDSERGIEPVAPDLKSWEQLNQYKDLFATAETGDKGRLLGGVAGWETRNAERIEALGLEFERIYAGSEGALIAEAIAAYDRGDPILFYLWTPHWFFAQYPSTEIELPPYSDECWETDFGCDWANDVVFKAFRVGFEDDFPRATEFIKNYWLTNEQQAQMMVAVDVDGLSPEEAVKQWMAENEEIWKAWIP
jgi:glycine betaine/proline transport system substrate-binding protein